MKTYEEIASQDPSIELTAEDLAIYQAGPLESAAPVEAQTTTQELAAESTAPSLTPGGGVRIPMGEPSGFGLPEEILADVTGAGVERAGLSLLSRAGFGGPGPIGLSLLAGGAATYGAGKWMGQRERDARINAGLGIIGGGIAETVFSGGAKATDKLGKLAGLGNKPDELYDAAKGTGLFAELDIEPMASHLQPDQSRAGKGFLAAARRKLEKYYRYGDLADDSLDARAVLKTDIEKVEDVAAAKYGDRFDKIGARDAAGHEIQLILTTADQSLRDKSSKMINNIMPFIKDSKEYRGTVIPQIRDSLQALKRKTGAYKKNVAVPFDPKFQREIETLEKILDHHKVKLGKGLSLSQETYGNLPVDLITVRNNIGELLNEYSTKAAAGQAVPARSWEAARDLYWDGLMPSMDQALPELKQQLKWSRFRKMYSEYKDHQNSVQSLITAGKSPESTLKMLLKNKDTFESFMYFQKEAGVDAVPMIREAIIRDALRVSAGTADDIPKLNKFKTQIAQARKGIDPDLRRQILDSSGGAEAIKDTEDILTVYEVLKRTQKRFSDYNEDSVRAMLQSGKMSKGLIAALRKHFPEMNQAARDATTSLFERRAINFGGAMGRAYSPAQYDTTQGPYPEMSALTGQGRQPGVNMPTAEDNKFMNLGQLLRGATQ